jgi:hypothetical protein
MEYVQPKFLSRNLDSTLEIHISEPGQVYIIAQDSRRLRNNFHVELFRLIPGSDLGWQTDIMKFPVRDEVASVPGHPRMWTFLRSSLETCLREHTICMEHQNPNWFPERLLSIVRDREGHPVAQLIQTRYQRPNAPYIALSHCWGLKSFIRTTSENIQSHEVDIQYSKLPRTFQDAIRVTLEMSVAYLWIDSLCIVQDQEDDWAQHAEMMDKIYENALFVAAAVSSSASSVPFLGPDAPAQRDYFRATKIELPTKDHVQPDDRMSVLWARRHIYELGARIISGPLERRAWAWQERYCATRIISFTEVEAKWQCRVAVGCECLGRLRNHDHGLEALSKDKNDIFKEWRSICTRYSHRDLTYSRDRLPALAGIAARFYARLGSAYVAGLWADELPFNLGWHRRGMESPFVDNGVPTWSWASMDGMVSWRSALGLEMNSRVEIMQVNCIPSAKNAFGAVRAGSFIELRGRVVPATMECDVYDNSSVSKEGFNAQRVLLDGKTISITISSNGTLYKTMRRATGSESSEPAEQDRVSEMEENGNVRKRGSVFCLLLYTATHEGSTQACVLILGQVSEGGNECYQRLGLGHSGVKDWDWAGERWEKWEEWFADAEIKTLRIV